MREPHQIPDWVTFPDDDWREISAEDAGLDPDGFRAFVDGLDVREAAFGGEDHSNGRWGAVLTPRRLPAQVVGRPALPHADGLGRQGLRVGGLWVRGGGWAGRPGRANPRDLDG